MQNDADHFIFHAAKDQKLVMEVFARRLESPLDSVLTLFDAEGKKLAEADDTVDLEYPLITHHADSKLSFTFPADGDYVLRIRDAQGKSGPEYAYRLLIHEPHPDFALRVTPSNPRVVPGDSTMLTVQAIRKDQFKGQIDLDAADLPSGFIVSKSVVPGAQDKALLTITAPPDAQPGFVFPTIIGRATIGGRRVTRRAADGDVMIQAFTYAQVILAQELVLAAIEGGALALSSGHPADRVVDLPIGGEFQVPVKITRLNGATGGVALKGLGLPGFLTVKYIIVPPDLDEAMLVIGATKLAPSGFRHAVVVAGTLIPPPGSKDIRPTTRTLPAIQVHVVKEGSGGGAGDPLKPAAARAPAVEPQ